MYPQALPLRSHHFQKVGKKPELTLIWEPEDTEQEPVQQVSTRGWGSFARIPLCARPPLAPVHALLPPGAPLPGLPCWPTWPGAPALRLPCGISDPACGDQHSSPISPTLGQSFPVLPALPWGQPLWGEAGGSVEPSKAGF